MKTDKGQPQKQFISVAFPEVSKLDLAPEMLPSVGYIMTLLKIAMKIKTGLLMHVYI